MGMLGVVLTHAVASQLRKEPFFFSRFNFKRMKEVGNTHYCFHCGGDWGFKLGPQGEVTNHIHEDRNYMRDHNPLTCADGILSNADKYSSPGDWLQGEINIETFPYVVGIPSI